MTDTTCDLNRVNADERREPALSSDKFPVIIAGLRASSVSVETEPEDQRLKAAARMALQLGGED